MFQKKFLKGCMLVTGGAKSGKSRLALDFCNSLDKNRVFLATAQAFDREMTERIRRHKEERGSGWSAIEEPLNVAEAISSVDNKNTGILFDCFTLWLNNLYMENKKQDDSSNKAINNLLELLTNI
ncbi:MAG: bifunctional adenosylcobinamide kinase/adenosylcobinamide-phosphate guanylyltransferase, partial [Deltaproteobacteria bacterium]|nr:bifunctional adenosylcobinamide kinase/adenosylcobinamide-phosphate guanylyltransferase [Deltaproteobacteria bacterium]